MVSLRYMLLGIPKTFGEFVDRARRHGNKLINVASVWRTGHGAPVEYGVRVEAGETSLRLDEYDTDSGQDAFTMARETAMRLRREGLNVTFNGIPFRGSKVCA